LLDHRWEEKDTSVTVVDGRESESHTIDNLLITWRQSFYGHQRIAHQPPPQALQHALVAGNRAALEGFWRETMEQGTPLIEPLSDDKEHILVTFVWRATADTTNVVLISELVNGWWWNNFADSTLTRLLDTNLYYRTYRVRSNTRFLYRLAPNHSLIHPLDVVDWDAYRAPMQPDPI
jgi:Domain of unknown function (DUF3327)